MHYPPSHNVRQDAGVNAAPYPNRPPWKRFALKLDMAQERIPEIRTTDTSQPPCTADPDLWFAVEATDLRRARIVCQSCPLISRCRNAIDTMEERRSRAQAVDGLWAGETPGERYARRGGLAAYSLCRICGIHMKAEDHDPNRKCHLCAAVIRSQRNETSRQERQEGTERPSLTPQGPRRFKSVVLNPVEPVSTEVAEAKLEPVREPSTSTESVVRDFGTPRLVNTEQPQTFRLKKAAPPKTELQKMTFRRR